MTTSFTPGRLLFGSIWCSSRPFHFAQRRKLSTKVAPKKHEVLLDLLDQAGQDITQRTDSWGNKLGHVAKTHGDEPPQELRSSMPQLPLSPLMDPKLVAARQKYRTSKPQPTGKASALEKRLSKSPYGRCLCQRVLYQIHNFLLIKCIAHALVSPIRHCHVTDCRLPSFFLLDFGITRNPMTGTQWQLPRLAVDPILMSNTDKFTTDTNVEITNRKESPEVQSRPDGSLQDKKIPSDSLENVSLHKTSTKTRNLDGTPMETPETLSLKTSNTKTLSSSPNRQLETSTSKSGSRRASSCYYLCSQPTLRFLCTLTNKQRIRIVPHAWKADSGIQANQLVWRKDMDSFVLELMRKKVFVLLRILASSRGGYIAPCAGYSSVHLHHQVGAVLWLGPKAPDKFSENLEQAVPAGTSPSSPREEIVSHKSSSFITASPTQATDSTSYNTMSSTENKSNSPSDSPEHPTPSPSSSSPAPPPPAAPPPYAMIKSKNSLRSHYIPIFNLPHLLGAEHFASLQASLSFSGTQGNMIMAIIKKKQRTVNLQMELWKLMGYLAPIGAGSGELGGGVEEGGGGGGGDDDQREREGEGKDGKRK